jgi:hypothetical protein
LGVEVRVREVETGGDERSGHVASHGSPLKHVLRPIRAYGVNLRKTVQ